MTVFRMALRSLRQRFLATCLTAASIALGVALVVAVLVLEREARAAFRGTALGVEILVGGTKGSRVGTLLSSLYHVGRAPGRVSWSYNEKLRDHPDVDYAIPLAYGDSYRGAPIVGTTPEIFTRFRPRPGVGFEIRGETFRGAGRRAVVGAEAARRTGLALGDTFFPSHSGLEDDHRHREETFTVVGIARATGTAHDRVIWIDIERFLALRGHAGLARGNDEEKAVSAVLVKAAAKSPLIVEGLIRRINDGTEAQAIRPLQVVGELFALVGDVQRILTWVAVLVVVVAAVSVMVAIYNTMADRRREIAILRALGATRARVLVTVLVEAALLCAFGAAAGLLLGHGGATLAAPLVEARAGVRLEGTGLLPWEPLLVAALFAVGCVAGLVPGLTAYRVDVVRGLEPVS
jgi:putative ABC transport system permease protein